MRGHRIYLSIFLAGIAGNLTGHAAETETATGVRVGMVDVSKVFKNYNKVYEVQKEVDKLFEPRRNALAEENKTMMELGEKIRRLRQELSGQSEFLFDQVQYFQKQIFLYEKKRSQLDEDFVKHMRTDMQEVLNEIRAAINAVAKTRNISLVMRAPDEDQMKALDQASPKRTTDESVEKAVPAGDGEKDRSQINDKIQQILSPRSVADVIGLFKRNQILFGSEEIDLTDSVLESLNGTYRKKGGG